MFLALLRGLEKLNFLLIWLSQNDLTIMGKNTAANPQLTMENVGAPNELGDKVFLLLTLYLSNLNMQLTS